MTADVETAVHPADVPVEADVRPADGHQSVTRDALTQGGRWVCTRLVRLLDRPGSRTGGRPTFSEAREWHHKCAGYYEVSVVRWLRLAWGYAHLLLVKSSGDFTEWLTESPARFFVTVAVVLVFWLGS